MRTVAVVGAAAIVAGVWYITSQEALERESGEVISVSGESQEIEAGAFERDSDNDGLRDWEEALWETDPANPDTDGDGVSDGEEVRAGRNPTVPGPNDTLTQADMPIHAREESTLTTSESFQKEFLERITKANRQGSVTETDLQEMLMQLAEEYGQTADSFSFYAESDITVGDTSETSVRTYLNSLGKLAKEYADAFPSERIVSIQRIFTEPGADHEVNFNSLVEDFERVEEELATLSVPRDLASTHTDALNGIAAMRSSLETILEVRDSDSLRAIIEMSSFTSGLTLFGEAVEEIQTYTQTSNINFDEDEPAHVLLDL